MKRVLSVLLLAALGPLAHADPAPADWPNLAVYRDRNAARLAQPPAARRVVFMGDSITEGWPLEALRPSFVNRGISGQTTPQMLLRFRADVLDLKPRVVVILAGTNDIAGNTGPATPEMIEGNIASMAELAKAHHVRVVIGALVPAAAYYWAPTIQPAPVIAQLNQWLRDYARRQGHVFVDFHTPMAEADQSLRKAYSEDGVHPNAAGYAVMNELVLAALAKLGEGRP
jgi:lysophospholipase L1-like esterase